MTKNKLQEELDERFLLILPVFTALLGALLVILAVRDLNIGPVETRAYYLTTDVILVVCTFALWLVLLRWKPPVQFAHPLGMLLFFGLITKNLLMVYLGAEVIFASQSAVAILAMGCVFLSVRWFAVTLSAIIVAWVIVTSLVLETSEVLAAGAPVIVGIFISVLLLRNRIRFHTTQIFLEQRVEMLERLLPMCASCKKVRTDEGEWAPIENYLADELERAVAHTFCPECQGSASGMPVVKDQSGQ